MRTKKVTRSSAITTGHLRTSMMQGGDQAVKPETYEYEYDDDDDDSSDGMRDEPSSGPIRTQHATGSSDGGAGPSKTPIARPVKSACTFCRSRKSRCNGKQPCTACINRGRTDDCVYTISRRGGKVKSKNGQRSEPFEAHLEKLLGLSDLPHLVRIPNMVPQLQAFHETGNDFDMFQGIDASQMLAALTNPTHPGQQNGFHSSVTSPSALLTPQSQSSRSTGMPTLDATAISAPSPKALLMDYYTYIYRFVPVLPAPQYIDVVASAIQPGSALMLSLQCIVPILRDQPLLPQAHSFASDEERKVAIRAEAQFYARQAYDVIDEVLERAENQQDKEEAGILEVIQALCILVIYEYGSGRALKSRLKVDAALTLAMSKGLHRLSATRTSSVETKMTSMSAGGPHYLAKLPTEEVFEVRKRVWWTLWMHAMWTAYNTGRIPTVRADDSRVTSDLPSCPDGSTNLWSNVVSSLQGLLLVQDRVLALTHIEMGRGPTERTASANGASLASPAGSERTQASGMDIPKTFSGLPTMLSREDVLRSMVELDAALQQQMRVLEETTSGVIGPTNGTPHTLDPNEDETQRILKFLWAIQVYTTSLTLHIGQAFQGATLFERKLCFLSTISEANDEAACQVPMPNAFDDTAMSDSTSTVQPVALAPTQDLYARGPFLPRDSLKRCVDASDKLLSISRNLRRSEGHMASPNPFNACSFVLISFVCLMQALAISSTSQEESWDSTSGLDTACDGVTTAGNQSSSSATSTLLRSAQGAAALTPSQARGANSGFASDNAVAQVVAAAALQSPPATFFGGVSAVDGVRPSRQGQLQQIWARVKEAKDALQGLSRYWDMVIPMREEVSGCLEASQFLLSQQPQTSAPVELATLGGGTL